MPQLAVFSATAIGDPLRGAKQCSALTPASAIDKALDPASLSLSKDASTGGDGIALPADHAVYVRHFGRSLAILESVLAPGHRHIADLCQALAASLEASGEIVEAGRLYRRALTHRQALGEADGEEIGLLLRQLGLNAEKLSDYEAAEAFARRSLAAYKLTSEADKAVIEIAAGEKILGDALVGGHRMEEARSWFEQAQRRLREAGDESDNLAYILTSLGIMASLEEAWAESENYHRRALAIYQADFVPDDARLIMGQANVAEALYRRGQIDAAARLFQEVLATFERLWGPEHPDLIAVINNLGRVRRTQGRLAEALELHRRALAIGAEALGSGCNPVNLETKEAIAEDLVALGRREEAEALFKEVLDSAAELCTATKLTRPLWAVAEGAEEGEPIHLYHAWLREAEWRTNQAAVAALFQLARLYRSQGRERAAKFLDAVRAVSNKRTF